MAPITRVIDRSSFQFATSRMIARSSAGTLYTREVPIGMPRIPPQLLQCAFYLYRSREDAENGAQTGGTGFFVGLQSQVDPSVDHTVAITNWHVAVAGGASIIRVNKAGGGVDIFELEPSEWIFKPYWHDLAAVPIPIDTTHNCTVLKSTMLLTKETAEGLEIAPGEDVFMIGRFVDHDGREANIPAVRFGNISMNPDAPIKQGNGILMESYCVDMHSRGGFSGSPVFAYRTAVSDLNIPLSFSGMTRTFLMLLGISWGQFPELWQITEGGDVISHAEGPSGYLIGKYVRGMSGITCVTPAWAILELLQHEKIQAALAAEEAKLAGLQLTSGAIPAPE